MRKYWQISWMAKNKILILKQMRHAIAVVLLASQRRMLNKFYAISAFNSFKNLVYDV